MRFLGEFWETSIKLLGDFYVDLGDLYSSERLQGNLCT